MGQNDLIFCLKKKKEKPISDRFVLKLFSLIVSIRDSPL